MGKRKKKCESNFIAKRPKSEKAEQAADLKAKEIFTSLEFTQMLQDPVLYVKGLQQFCRASRLHKDSRTTHDIVKAYISVSPDSAEIFKCIEKGKTSPINVCLVFEAFVAILLRTGGDLSQGYASVGVSICRRLLQGHLRELYGALSLKNPARVVVPTLRMLTSMVMQSNECANDVATTLDLSGKIMTSLAKFQPNSKHGKTASTNIRLCFVRFVLSFFMCDDTETVKLVLEARGFVDGVFRGLPSDPASVIHTFLTGVLDKVIKNLLIPKTNKIKLLAAHDVLTSIADLFLWDGQYDIAAQDEDSEDIPPSDGKVTIRQLAYDFLYHSCCPHKYGINFKDREYGTATRSHNHVLLKFLVDLKIASDNTLAHNLVVEILRACPDLLHSYFTTCNLSFDPRPTEKWFQNCGLVLDVHRAQPSVPPAIAESAKTCLSSRCDPAKLVAMAIPGIVPSAFRRVVLKAALKHSNSKVQLQGCEILVKAFESLRSTIEFIEDGENWTNSNFSQQGRIQLKAVLCSEVSKVLPDIGSLIAIWSSSVNMPDSTSDSDVQEQLLKILSMCQENLPESFGQCQYDFSRLLFGVGDKSACRNTVLYAVKILSHMPHKYKWFKKGDNKQTSFYQLVKIITDLAGSEESLQNHEVLDKALHLYKKVCVMNSVIEHEESNEELVWIKQIALNSTEQPFLLTFLEDLCMEVAMRPHRFSDKNNYLLVNTNTKDQATSDIEINDKWWKSLPDVEIETATSDVQTLAVQNQNMQGSTRQPTQSVSLLLCAAFKWLNENADKFSSKYQVLDRYLTSVATELYYAHALSRSTKQFHSVLKHLHNDSPVKKKLPLLEETTQKNCPGTEIGDSLENYPVFTSATWFHKVQKKLEVLAKGKPCKTKKCMAKLEEKLSAAPSLTECFTSVLHDHSSAVICNPIEMHTTEILIAQNLHFLQATLQLSHKSCAESAASCAKVVQHITGSITLLLTKLNKKRFPLVASAILSNPEIQLSYLNTSIVEISTLVSEELNEVVLDLNVRTSKDRNFECSRFFFLRVESVMCNVLNDSTSSIPPMVWETFDKLSDLLEISSVQKILLKAIGTWTLSKSDHIHIQVSKRCIQLLTKTCTSNPLSSSNCLSLFAVLPLGELDEAKLDFVHHVVGFCAKFPSTALVMTEALLKWCVDHCENEDILNLLKIALQQSLTLQSNLLSHIVRKPAASVKHSIPVVAVAIKLPLMHTNAKFFASGPAKKFEEYLGVPEVSELIVSEAMKDTGDFIDACVSVLVWAMERDCLCESDNKLEQKVLEYLNVNNFATRWNVASSLLKSLTGKSEKRAQEFRQQLVAKILNLACSEMKDHQAEAQWSVKPIFDALSDILKDGGLNALTSSEELASSWNAFVKVALKHQISNPPVCDFLRKQICRTETTNCHRLLQPSTVFKMVTSHSIFLEIVLGQQVKVGCPKTSLLQLLHALVERCDASELRPSDCHYLLAAYQATLSLADQCILNILLLYESCGIPTADCTPFLWGNTALESYQARKNMGETLYKRPAPNKLLACIDREVMGNTLLRFPIRRRFVTLDRVKANQAFYEEEEPGADEAPRYDPQFLLSALSTILVPENLIDCRSFIRQGALSFLLVALSSHCPIVRSLAAGCLARFYDLAEPLWFPEKNLTLYLLRCVRNAMTMERGSTRKMSTIMGLYLAKMAEIMCQPAEHMYFALNRFLLVKPGLDLRHVPEFYVLFFSTDMEFKTERSWILKLIAQGVRDMGDYHVIQSRQLLRILMTYYASPTSDNKTRSQVLQVLEKCCLIRGAAFDLIYNLGLLPWLLNIATQRSDAAATRDGGTDAAKRQDPTTSLVGVLMALWSSLAPNRTHRDGATPSGDDFVPAEEEELENDEDCVHTKSAGGKQVAKRFTEVSLRLARQLINLSMALLSNILNQDNTAFRCVDLDAGTGQSLVDVISVSGALMELVRRRYGDDVVGCDVAVSGAHARLVHSAGRLLDHNRLRGRLQCVAVLLAWNSLNSNVRTLPAGEAVAIVSWAVEVLVTSQCAGHLLKPAVRWFAKFASTFTDAADGATREHAMAVRSSLLRVWEFLFSRSSEVDDFAELCSMLNVVPVTGEGNVRSSCAEAETENLTDLFAKLDGRRLLLMDRCLLTTE